MATKTIIEKIYDYSLEEIMGERFGRYSKYIIQDRALPDVRDGLKPVQRRILYSMYKDKNTFNNKTKKSAKAVGLVMGNYHPHGDSSIYDAMVRMSQSWKMRTPFIVMQGNNGSIDGDPAAAMRYTEAKLSKIANILLKDIDKESVMFSPTYDDVLLEPSVLPANFPNLLVNGSNGISAGYATNIPPHNLGEVIDATIKRIDNPNSRLETIMEIIKGPDFPTGGVLEGIDGIKQAYQTGKGKVVVKAKYEILEVKGKKQIIIHQIPYEVLKSNLIKKIEDIRIDKKIEGILEVRDESDKNDLLRVAIDLKKDANIDLIINYLLKNTEMQVNYNFNVIAIVNRRPKILGLLEILDAFIVHQKEVVKKRSEFDLKHAQARLHIVEGLIKALGILDQVIKTIRKSKNKQDAITNLVNEYQFTSLQAEAIVNLQLYKLTNTDVTLLQEESDNLHKIIEFLKSVLSSEEILKTVMKKELKEIKHEFATPRLTEIREEVTEIKIDTTQMINKDDYIVIVTNDGYVKKVSIKSYKMSEEETGLKEGDYILSKYKLNNLDTLILFTNLGNYLYLPIHEITEFKYKEIGKHIGNIIKINENEKIIKAIAVNNFNNQTIITAFTKNGMTKRMELSNFVVTRYSKPITMFKLKEDDEVISISKSNNEQTLVITKDGYANKFKTDTIPIVGLKTSGVRAIKLSEDDQVISGLILNEEKDYITLFTNESTSKRIKTNDILETTRAKKGSLIIKSPKIKKYELLNAFNTASKENIGLIFNDQIKYIKVSEINIMEKASVGSKISKLNIKNAFIEAKLKVLKEKEVQNTQEDSQKDITENMTMSDFFEDFKI